MSSFRELAAPFVVSGPCGVAVRDRLKHLTPQDEKVLRLVGEYQGRLASRDLKARCADGLEHGAESWASRKRGLTGVSSSRIAGAITKATHDQWALARRCQAAHIQTLEAGIRTLRYRLSLPIGAPGTKRAAGGYRSRGEWFHKSRRLKALEARHTAAVADRQAGRVRVVRGGKRLLNTRHHLAQAHLTEEQWRERWEAERWFLAADGESGKRFATPHRRLSRHDAAGIAIGRRALGHPIRRRTAPPRAHQGDVHGHRTAQARPGTRGRDGTRPPATDHAPRGVPPNGTRKRRPSASNTVRDAPSTHEWVLDSLMHTG
ncbi:hypothetical protein [Streptomyces sp. NPDC018352]|uniref:hypothetical protein n=1 Tax=Streptomyces sp. NPDC018352 TaxID=3157194 RepID=UPI003407DF80